MTGPMRLHALRGAIDVDRDDKELVHAQTQRLLREMLARNAIAHDDVVSMIFTATPDLRSTFPAAAARAMGFTDVALLGAQELDVDGGLPRTIRILIHCYSDRPREAVRHVFLDGARALRTDLPE